jgi:hypothetical protein
MAELDEIAEARVGDERQQLAEIRNLLTGLEANCAVD